MATLFQRSTIGALLAGVFDGTETVAGMLRHGDFGLGTFNALDGELVVLDGVAYQVTSDGIAREVEHGKRTPFAAVTEFRAEHSIGVPSAASRSELTALIHSAARSENLTLAVRISGTFRHILMRTVSRQSKPYPSLDEASRNEIEIARSNLDGVLVGFRTPEFEHSIGVAGFHLHFLDDARSTGGHMLDFVLERGTVELMELTDIQLSLPSTGAFLRADLDPADATAKIARAEGNESE